MDDLKKKQWDWIKQFYKEWAKFLHSDVKDSLKLLQMIDCSSCCQDWHGPIAILMDQSCFEDDKWWWRMWPLKQLFHRQQYCKIVYDGNNFGNAAVVTVALPLKQYFKEILWRNFQPWKVELVSLKLILWHCKSSENIISQSACHCDY